MLKDETTGRFVARDTLGWSAASTRSAATPFRTQATALGRYLLYGTGGQMPQGGLARRFQHDHARAAGRLAAVTVTNGRLGFTNLSNGKGLSVTAAGRLGQSDGHRGPLVARRRHRAAPRSPRSPSTPRARRCEGASPTARVRGFLDAHTHIGAYEFLGGRFHCGLPWSPYGVTVALQDCPDHEPNGAGAVAENFFVSGSPVGTHSTDGWPKFDGWPRPESLTHEGTYWRWLERAWRGGLRLVVNDLVENRALCEIYPLKKNSCDEMESVRLQARDMVALQDYIDAQFRGPGKGFFRIVRTPAEARRVINSGKLAVVLGVEISEVLGCGMTGGTPDCTTAQIDRELDELYALGVRSAVPGAQVRQRAGRHRLRQRGHGPPRQRGQQVRHRLVVGRPALPAGLGGRQLTHRHRRQPGRAHPGAGRRGQARCWAGTSPATPTGPLCNPKGLTALGAYVINGMIDRGMIVETDHFSVKARGQVLDILERRRYPGVITSHSWGDDTSQRRLQALGGVVAPYGHETDHYAHEWATARAGRKPGALFGVGWGSDTNGLGAQPQPRVDAFLNPVTYPFRTFDGGTVVSKQRSGTRVYDINLDGVPHYGLRPDYVEDLRKLEGSQIVADMANGAEVYLRMWAQAQAARTG